MFRRKYIAVIVQVEKEVTIIVQNGEKIIKKNILHIDSARFIARLLSNLVNNFSEEIHSIKCKFMNTTIKDVKHVELNVSIATWMYKL